MAMVKDYLYNKFKHGIDAGCTRSVGRYGNFQATFGRRYTKYYYSKS